MAAVTRPEQVSYRQMMEADVDAVVGEIGSRPAPVAGELVAGPDVALKGCRRRLC